MNIYHIESQPPRSKWCDAWDDAIIIAENEERAIALLPSQEEFTNRTITLLGTAVEGPERFVTGMLKEYDYESMLADAVAVASKYTL